MQHLRIEVADRIAVVVLDNPPVNAQPPALWAELAQAFDELGERADVAVTILTGAGRVFSAGADLVSQATPEPEAAVWRRLRACREATYAILEHRHPVVGAVNGPAVGLGVSLLACCDMLVCADHASLSLPELSVGLVGGARHAMRILSPAAVRYLFFTGRRMDAQEMYRRGLVERCVPAAELMAAARDIAGAIAAQPPQALRIAKETFRAIESMTLRDGYRYEQDRLVELSRTEEAREALSAFVEKRAPVFRRASSAPAIRTDPGP